MTMLPMVISMQQIKLSTLHQGPHFEWHCIVLQKIRLLKFLLYNIFVLLQCLVVGTTYRIELLTNMQHG